MNKKHLLKKIIRSEEAAVDLFVLLARWIPATSKGIKNPIKEELKPQEKQLPAL